MLKTFLAILLILSSFNCIAQVNEKTTTLGTTIYYWSNKNTTGTYDDTYKESMLNLSVGRAIRQNLVFGISFGYTPIRQSGFLWGSDTLNLSYDEYAPGVFARHYKKLAECFYFYAQVDADAFIRRFDQNVSQQGVGPVRSNQWGASLALTPGVSYQLYGWLQAELSLPNLVSVNYAVMNLDFEREQVPDERHRYFYLRSALEGGNQLSSVLGYMSLGFRFMF